VNASAHNKRFLPVIVLLTLSSFSLLAETSPPPQTTPPPPESETGIVGVITVGPVHGGPIRPGVPSSKPLANADFVVEKDKGAVTSFKTDDEGRFRVLLEPGRYTVSMKGRKGGIGRYGPFKVDVTAGQMTKVQWTCDTGMRLATTT
jgi:hypothetical protein